MATITTGTSLFPSQLVNEVFDKVKGHSSLAILSAQTPIPFAGQDLFVFSMDGEASIVGEGVTKPAGEAAVSAVTIKPIKFVYQHRITDEFVNMSEEAQIPYLAAFTDGFAKKIGRALDIAAFHGVNPADGEASDIVGSNNFDTAVTNEVTYDSSAPDDNIDDAVTLIQEEDGIITGIAMSTAFGSALGKLKTTDGYALYPEFRFGQNPGAFAGVTSDVNNTVSFGDSTDQAIVGDFANAFRWGYSANIPMEIIEYGNPDGLGDLKQLNQIVLRAEAYIGWGILDADSFARITEATA